MRVVFAALDRIKKLSDDEKRGITGVVMYVFQPRVGDLAPIGLEQIDPLAVVRHDLEDQFKVHRQHIWGKDHIILLHFFCKLNVIVFHFVSFRI